MGRERQFIPESILPTKGPQKHEPCAIVGDGSDTERIVERAGFHNWLERE